MNTPKKIEELCKEYSHLWIMLRSLFSNKPKLTKQTDSLLLTSKYLLKIGIDNVLEANKNLLAFTINGELSDSTIVFLICIENKYNNEIEIIVGLAVMQVLSLIKENIHASIKFIVKIIKDVNEIDKLVSKQLKSKDKTDKIFSLHTKGRINSGINNYNRNILTIPKNKLSYSSIANLANIASFSQDFYDEPNDNKSIHKLIQEKYVLILLENMKIHESNYDIDELIINMTQNISLLIYYYSQCIRNE